MAEPAAEPGASAPSPRTAYVQQAGERRQQWSVRALDARWLATLGTASYSLYLWHGPIIESLSRASWMPGGFLPLAAVGAAVCCAIALLSYRVVEAPFLRLRRAWSSTRVPEQLRSPYGELASADIDMREVRG